MGPTGARCRECASPRSSHIYQVKPGHLVLAFAASAVLGVLGGLLVEAAGCLLLWALFYAPAMAPVITRIIDRFTGGKRGPLIAAAASLGFTLGALSLPLGSAWLEETGAGAHAHHVGPLLLIAAFNPLLLLFILVAVGGLWYWLK